MAQLQSTSITGSLIVTGGITGSFSGSITSPGSNTQVLFNNSGVISANSGFVYSGSNVGIGTTNPGAKLEVASAASGTTMLVGRATGNSSIKASSDAGGYLALDSTGGGTILNHYSSDNIWLVTGGGNVGINTTSPSYKLDVNGSLNVAANVYNYIGGNKAFAGNGSSQLYFYTGTTALTVRNNADSATLITITDDGKLGIGTTSPAQKLHVVGNTAVTGITSTGDRKLSLGILDLNSGGTPTQIRINTTIPFNSPSADFTVNIKGFRYGAPQMVSLSIGWHYYLSSFYNETAISNGAWKPTISLAQDAGGYVVIHLSSPAYWPKLYVESVYSSAYGDVYSSGWNWTDADLSNCTNVEVVPYQALATDITGNAGSTSAVSGTTNYVSKFTSATAIGNSQIFDDGTNVGIGTTSPSAKLTVVGDGSGVALIGLSGFGSNYTGLSLNGTLNTSAYNLLSSPTDTHLYINRPSGKDIYFRMANNDQVAITSAGNVGIGTTTPTLGTLQVNGNVYATSFTGSLLGTASYATQALSSSYAVTASYALTAGSTTAVTGTTNYVSKFTSATAIGNSQIFDDGTNVGIGTTNPGSDGGVVPRLAVANPSNVDKFVGIGYDNTGDYGFIHAVHRATAWKNIAIQAFGGNVGIGTTSPSQKLEVSGGDALIRTAYIGNISAYGTNYASFSHTSRSVAAKYSFLSGNAGDTYINAANSQAIYFRNENIDQMIITSAGNVGIGTTSPGFKLDVTGTFGTSGDATFNGTNTYINSSNIAVGNNSTDVVGVSGNTMYFPGNGNVGIGTTSPTENLTIFSNSARLSVTGTSGASAILLGNQDSAGANNPAVIYAANGSLFFGGGSSWSGGGTFDTTMALTDGGLVGIGSTSPSAKLYIAAATLGTSTNDYVLNSIHYNSNGNSEELEIKSVRESAGSDWTYGGKRIQLRIDATYMGYMQFNGYGNQAGISFGTGTTVTAPGNVTERMRILSNGNVGIGTTNPIYALDINNTGASTARVRVLANTNYALLQAQNSGGVLYLGVDDSSGSGFSSGAYSRLIWSSGAYPLIFAVNDAERMRISSGGALKLNTYGSGTNTGTVAYNLAVDSSGNVIETAGGVVDGSGTANYIPKWQDANTLTNSVIYETSSNIGIGTTSPGAKLEVNGSFRATTKSFLIDHPTKEGKKLQYGVLEGPEHSVYVRGKLTNTSRIELPDYWHALVDENSITVNLTAIGRKQELWVEEITDTYITVGSEAGIINCFYAVFAERKDVEKLVTEFDKE